MEFISKHKFATFTVIMLLILIVLGIALFRFLVPNYDLDEYGNRLNGIKNYRIENTKVEEMKTAIEENDNVDSVSYLLEGRLIDITITVKDETERDEVKKYAEQALTYFTEEQRGFYDIQVLVASDNRESEKYPIIGYKHKSSGSLVWSNN